MSLNRPRRMTLCLLGALALAGTTRAPIRAQVAEPARRQISDTDLFTFVWVADPRISPDGAKIAFVRVTVNEKDDLYDTAIWLVASSGSEPARRLTGGTRDSSPRWSSDGKRLAFLRAGEKDGRPQPGQIFLLEMDGGEAHPVTDMPRGAGPPEWSPDGRTLAFTSTAFASEMQKPGNAAPGGAAPAGTQPAAAGEKPAERKSDVRVITKAVYRANGPGYIDPGRQTHIWTVAVSGHGQDRPQPTMITSGAFDERGLVWSPDGSMIYFSSDRVLEPYYQPSDSDLYRVPAGGGEITKIASIDGTISEVTPSPDGRRLAFVGALNGTPVRSFSQPDLFVTDATPGSTPKNLTTAYDFDVTGSIAGDQRAPRGEMPHPLVWAKDGSAVVVVSAEHGSSNLKRINAATGAVEAVTEGAQDVAAYTASADAGRVAMVISTVTNVGDIFVTDMPAPKTTAKLAQITRVNDDLFRTLAVPAAEEMWYTSFDGKKIQGWILKPADFDATKKYPLILEIHGGPHSAYGHTFTHEFTWMAAKGYVVLYTNPRGSTSYGQEFGNVIQFHYPGDDYKDLMAGVDELLKRGYIDEKRMGVTGGSGGGVLTNWTITHTTRFAAAVSQRSIADWSGFWYTADFTLFEPSWFRKAPWEDPADFAERSAITHIDTVTTPLMLVEGEADMRTPPADGGEIMFRALKYRKIPTVMVRFPGETHELSRSGAPWHRVERLRHIVGWMDKWLMGVRTEVYDVK